MTSLLSTKPGTSIGLRAKPANPAGVHVLNAILLAGASSASTTLYASPATNIVREAPFSTGIGIPVTPAWHLAHPISELRLRSGLTWEQLAKIFGVSRRAVHFWASGSKMRVENEQKLQEVMAAFRRIDTGRASENRMLLATPLSDGGHPVDLLAAGEYERFAAGLGGRQIAYSPGPARHIKVDAPALGPGTRINGLRGVAHVDSGIRRPAKSKRRESGS